MYFTQGLIVVGSLGKKIPAIMHLALPPPYFSISGMGTDNNSPNFDNLLIWSLLNESYALSDMTITDSLSRFKTSIIFPAK